MPDIPWSAYSIGVDMCACCAGLTLLVTRRPRPGKEFTAVALVVFTLLLFSYSRCYDDSLVLSLFVALCVVHGASTAVEDELRTLCRICGIALTCAALAAITLSFLHILPSRGMVPNARVVFTYGTPHPNSLGALIFGAMAALTYAEWSRTWQTLTVLSLAAAAFTYVALSSHAAAVACLLLVGVQIVGHIQIGALCLGDMPPRRVHQALLVVVPMVLLIGMLVMTAVYNSDNTVMTRLNGLTHGRIHYAHAYYEELGGFTIFGRSELTADQYNGRSAFWGVDSGFCFFALEYGMVPMAVLTAIYLASTRRIARRRDFALTALILLGFLYLVIERVPFSLYTTPWLLLIVSGAFFRQTETTKATGRYVKLTDF